MHCDLFCAVKAYKYSHLLTKCRLWDDGVHHSRMTRMGFWRNLGCVAVANQLAAVAAMFPMHRRFSITQSTRYKYSLMTPVMTVCSSLNHPPFSVRWLCVHCCISCNMIGFYGDRNKDISIVPTASRQSAVMSLIKGAQRNDDKKRWYCDSWHDNTYNLLAINKQHIAVYHEYSYLRL